jgi:PAS domain S-box-containing protein
MSRSGGQTGSRAQVDDAARVAEAPSAHAESALLDFFKVVIEQSRSLLCTLDLDGRILYANRGCTQAFGYRVDELIGRSIFDLVHPADLGASRAAFASVVGGETVRDFAARLLDRGGEPVHVLGSGALLRDDRGNAIAVSIVATDVSEVHRLEDETADLRETLAEILETSDVLFVGADIEGRVVSWNRACEETTRVPRAAAIGRSAYELLARAQERDRLRDDVRGLIDGGRSLDFECPLPGLRGEARHVSWNVSLRRSPSGQAVGFLAMGRDTTETHRAEHEAMQVRETLENILQSLTDGLFVIAPAGETTYWNRRMEELTGLTWADVINRRTEEAFPWLFQTDFARAREELLRGRLDAHESPPRSLATPQGRASVVIRALPYRSADGQIAGTIVTVRDVTESLRLRADLVQSESRYKNLVESARDCIHVLDLAGRFVEVNRAGLALIGLTDATTILGKRYDQLVDAESSAVALRSIERARAGESVEFEIVTTLADGRRVFWSSVLAPVRDARGRVRSLLGISRDITDRKRLEEELRQKNERLVAALDGLERASTLKDDFLSHVSHELRTPLTSIRTYAEILLNYPDEELAEKREFLGIINEECRRLTGLLNDVLDLSKIEAGEMVWRIAPHAVEEFIRPAVEVSAPLAIRAGVTVTPAIAAELPAVLADKDRLEQVMINLLANAIKHSPAGGTICVSASLHVPGGAEGARATRAEHSAIADALVVRVVDEGSGIPAEEREHVFDKYFQTGPASRQKGGSGLGLAICREIVDAVGGEIWVESPPGGGTAFAFTVPIASAAA